MITPTLFSLTTLQKDAMSSLNQAYDRYYVSPSNCGIDERLFVIHDPTVS